MVLVVSPVAAARAPMRIPAAYPLTFQCAGRFTVGVRNPTCGRGRVAVVELLVLTVPDCPNGPVLEKRLAEALADQADIVVTRRVIEDEAGAQQFGMLGSPTLLVDGIDPFAEPGMSASLSCRLYRGAGGRVA